MRHSGSHSQAVYAWLPRLAPGDPITGSKLGGTPWLDGPWPRCGSCGKPVRFVLQLRREDLPAEARALVPGALLQLFLCDTAGTPDDPSWVCQAHGGWAAFAPSTVVRCVSPTGPSLSFEEALPTEDLLALAVQEQAEQHAFLRELGLPLPGRSEASGRRAEALATLPTTHQQALTLRTWRFAPEAIVGWEPIVDVPWDVVETWVSKRLVTDSGGDSSNAQIEDLQAQAARQGLSCEGDNKLAGHPRWRHDPDVPRCPSCGPMVLVMQLALGANPRGPTVGTGWVWSCRGCGALTHTWQG